MEMTIFYTVLLFIAAYLMGAPLGYYLVKLKTRKDIRADFRDVGGSSSSGATNVKRALGIRWALFAAFCDYLKGAAPTAIAIALLWGTHWVVGLLGLVSLLGNLFPVLVSKPRFKGGKGVATTGGALTPMVAVSPDKLSSFMAFAAFRRHHPSLGDLCLDSQARKPQVDGFSQRFLGFGYDTIFRYHGSPNLSGVCLLGISDGHHCPLRPF